MHFWREYLLAAGREVRGVYVVPVVEVWMAGSGALLASWVASVRPLGFAVLTPDRGYWLVEPGEVAAMAHAVAQTTAEVRAS